jgi:GxxExxY protein
LSEVLQACVEGRLGEVSLEWGDECAVCVVAASGGYPGEYEKGKVITGLEGPLPDQALVFHAGTARKGDALVTNGGRVLGITGLGKDFNEAREKAYKAMEQVHFDGMHYRQDIAANLLPRIGADSDGFRGLEGELLHADLTGKVIGAAMEVHRTLGPGFLESVYQEALAQEFRERQVPFERQKPVEVEYKGTVAGEFRADFLVAGRVLVELKAASALTALDEAQVVNYLRGTAAEVGILLNFGESSLRYRRLILTKKLKSAKSAANPRNPR